ncbi:unnamed protein product [Acidithrix sp. C25]|nr:unnamed protein product [Acidithrix sp. C25]
MKIEDGAPLHGFDWSAPIYSFLSLVGRAFFVLLAVIVRTR